MRRPNLPMNPALLIACLSLAAPLSADDAPADPQPAATTSPADPARPATPADPRAEIDALIKQLGDNSPKLRQEATDRLRKIGPDAVPALKEALTHDDLEVVFRAQTLLKQIEGHGVTVTSLTPEQHAAFVKATQPVFDKWKKTIGEDLVNQALKDIENRKK